MLQRRLRLGDDVGRGRLETLPSQVNDAGLQAVAREWPFFRTLLSNMEMVLAKSHINITSRYKDLVTDTELRETIFRRLKNEGLSSIDAPLKILNQSVLLEKNPQLAWMIQTAPTTTIR